LIVRRKKPPCYVDLMDKRSVIQYFRDLANVGHLLAEDVNILRYKFRKRLIEKGWEPEELNKLEEIAMSRTIWEQYLTRIRNRGDWWEYLRLRPRLK